MGVAGRAARWAAWIVLGTLTIGLWVLAVMVAFYPEEVDDWINDRICDMQGPESIYDEECR